MTIHLHLGAIHDSIFKMLKLGIKKIFKQLVAEMNCWYKQLISRNKSQIKGILLILQTRSK